MDFTFKIFTKKIVSAKKYREGYSLRHCLFVSFYHIIKFLKTSGNLMVTIVWKMVSKTENLYVEAISNTV